MIIYGSGCLGVFFSAGIGLNSGLLAVLLGVIISGVPLMFLDATGEFV